MRSSTPHCPNLDFEGTFDRAFRLFTSVRYVVLKQTMLVKLSEQPVLIILSLEGLKRKKKIFAPKSANPLPRYRGMTLKLHNIVGVLLHYSLNDACY